MMSYYVCLVVAVVSCINRVLTESDCQDLVACELYASEICTDPQYYQWTKTNCPRHCQLCTATTVNHLGVGKLMDSDPGAPSCFDANEYCASYGTVLCDDVKFYSWVNENCRKHCKRCDTSCRDTIPNCVDYGAEVCTQLTYYNWVEMHCRKFCGRCS